MWQLRFWMYLVLLALSTTSVHLVTACSCELSHPQTKFCRSDFVAVVRVRKMVTSVDYFTFYKVKVNKIFKANATYEMVLKRNTLRTSSSESLCGVTLNVGETYVVGGQISRGEAYISLCNLAIRWADVTPRQRKGFRRLYHYGCECKITYTPWWRKGAALETAGSTRCLWESTPGPQDCQEKYGVCMVGPGGCSWIPSTPYKNCITQHQRQREKQRLREP